MTDERGNKSEVPERAHHAGEGELAAPRQRLVSVKNKQEAVLRVLRGEGPEVVSREAGTATVDLSGWRDSFPEAGGAALKSRPKTDQGWDLKAMRESCSSRRSSMRATGRSEIGNGPSPAGNGERAMANAPLEAKTDRLGVAPPFMDGPPLPATPV